MFTDHLEIVFLDTDYDTEKVTSLYPLCYKFMLYLALKIYYNQVIIHFFQYSKCLMNCIWGQIYLKNNKFTIYIQLVHEGLLAGYICGKVFDIYKKI